MKGREHAPDVATGTGKVALELAKRLEKGHVTGFDLSEGMLCCAQEKMRDRSTRRVST